LYANLIQRMNTIQRRLLGESIREIGVLTLVLVPLDIWITPNPRAAEPNYPHWLAWAHLLTVDHWRILLFAIVGVIVLYYGIRIEAKATTVADGKEGGN
jgi:hypothetical protein